MKFGLNFGMSLTPPVVDGGGGGTDVFTDEQNTSISLWTASSDYDLLSVGSIDKIRLIHRPSLATMPMTTDAGDKIHIEFTVTEISGRANIVIDGIAVDVFDGNIIGVSSNWIVDGDNLRFKTVGIFWLEVEVRDVNSVVGVFGNKQSLFKIDGFSAKRFR